MCNSRQWTPTVNCCLPAFILFHVNSWFLHNFFKAVSVLTRLADSAVICNGSTDIPQPGHDLPFITNIVKDNVPPVPGLTAKGGKFPQQLSRKFCIDISPKLIWSNSTFVQTLVRSGVSRYLEFKCFHTCNMYLDGVQEVPCSKGGIFKNKCIGLKEKRGLMKFLTSIMQPNEEDTRRLQEYADKPFVDFIKDQQLSSNVLKFILYSIVNEETDQEKSLLHLFNI